MSAYYQRFLKTGLELDPFGLHLSTELEPYFCTPRGARIFADAGVDGIHYCFIKGFDQMVFAVNPSNAMGDEVHPLARDFKEFLQLLMGCGSVDALEQAHGWARTTFERHQEELQPDLRRSQLISAMKKQLKLEPAADPYGLVKAVQIEFDYSRIPYPREYREEMKALAGQPVKIPPWKIHYQGGFWSSVDGERPGREIRLDAPLSWGENWQMPAVYLCSRGMNVLVLHRASKAVLRHYIEHWSGMMELRGGNLTQEEEMRMMEEDPLKTELEAVAQVNGRELHWEGSCGIRWTPIQEEIGEPDPMAMSGMQHFGLDPEFGWEFHLISIPWGTRRRPKWNGCTVTLKQRESILPGPCFEVDAPGRSLEFKHPADGKNYRLTVEQVEAQTTDPGIFRDETLEMPTHFMTMEYTVQPPMEKGMISLQDCAAGDRPRRRVRAQEGEVYGRHKELYLPESVPGVALAVMEEKYDLESPEEAASMGIIGGADGPTAIFVSAVAGTDRATHLAAASSLHFEPVNSVKWRINLHVEHRETAMVEIKV